ncbi:MAG TPA: hypothetical protein VG497_19730 [Kribbella sp.]|nr:hypothetical protein [Kribbella sp.]
MSADGRVARSAFDGRIQPISRRRQLTVLPHKLWSDDEWQRIQLGYLARDMDEKWNVFAEESVVFLHRSWTGLGVFEVTFVSAEDGGWRISQAVVRRERFDAIRRLISRGTRDDDEFNCQVLESVLSTVASANRPENSE